jgi:hypothetical protein
MLTPAPAGRARRTKAVTCRAPRLAYRLGGLGGTRPAGPGRAKPADGLKAGPVRSRSGRRWTRTDSDGLVRTRMYSDGLG